jgi:hypothetical protein
MIRQQNVLQAMFVVGIILGASPCVAEPLKAHEIVYETSFKGIPAGRLVLTLTAGNTANTWHYETHALPNALASLVISSSAREQGWFSVTPDGVVPQRYLLESGETSRRHDSDVSYDWTARRITGQVEGATLSLSAPLQLQDVSSIRIAPTQDLLEGREPHEYTMLDGREIKTFVYTRIGSEHLKTALGDFDTVVFSSLGKGADPKGRSWHYWYAPSLGWLPVRIEQREAGSARLVFKARSLHWL